MPDLLTQAQPPLEFIPPAFNPLVLRVSQLAMPLWIHWQTAITQIEANNVERLVQLYQQFQEGKIRFMIAFRHPSVEDPLCLSQLVWREVPRVAQQMGVQLKRPIHAHFIYDRGIPLWAGAHMGWLYSRLGGTPIHRGKADWMGLRSARDLFANARFPIAASPEGATNGHNEIVSALEPGIAQLGFWCAEDLQKAGRSEQVLIVPLGIKYRYIDAPWQAIEKLLSEMEAVSGVQKDELESLQIGKSESSNQPSNFLTFQTSKLSSMEASLYRRLCRLAEHLLSIMEDFYTRFYHQKLPAVSVSSDSPTSANEAITLRLQTLLNVALQVAEQHFDLPAKGSVIDRCRRLEQAGWNYIYREELKNPKTLPPLKRGLVNRIADEAYLRMWHMRLVETFVSVTGHYVLEKPTVERFAETTLLLWDLITRIQGDTPFQRPQLGKQRVQLTVGEPISVSERYPAYQGSRQGAKQAVSDLTKDLQHALESLILSAES